VLATNQWSEWSALALADQLPSQGRALLSHYTADYHVVGSGPTIVLVPGLAGGTGLVQPLALSLSRHFQVISYELRGETDCFAVRRRFDIDDLADDLKEFVDSLALESPIIMGVSFGAAVALTFASRYPNRLSGIAVQGVNVRLEQSLFRHVAGQVLSGYPLPPDNKFVNQFFNLLFGRRPRDRSLFDFVTRQCWLTDQSVMVHRFRLVEQLDLSDRLADVTVPALLVRGDRDMLVSDRGWNELAARIPQATAVSVPGAGHLASVSHPRPLAEQVWRFAREKTLVEV
jgi:pimeloyl-ACP methyl ester carboxylesterase